MLHKLKYGAETADQAEVQQNVEVAAAKAEDSQPKTE